LFIMDLGVPRNVAGSAAEIYNVYIYNIDDLSDIVKQNRSARESEIPKAELIIDEHVGKFLSWQASVELVGFVSALRERVNQERSEFLRERLAAMHQLSSEDRDKVEGIVADLLERLLIEPAQQLRGERELRRKIQNVESLRDLFLRGKDQR
jgi:glutamyl-tRNA reductase